MPRQRKCLQKKSRRRFKWTVSVKELLDMYLQSKCHTMASKTRIRGNNMSTTHAPWNKWLRFEIIISWNIVCNSINKDHHVLWCSLVATFDTLYIWHILFNIRLQNQLYYSKVIASLFNLDGHCEMHALGCIFHHYGMDKCIRDPMCFCV